MELADVLVALGGDKGNTVPKRVTAAEILVLRQIHGDDAVFDIRPADHSEIRPREELARLRGEYGGAKDQNGDALIERVYPGANPPVPTTLDDLELPEEFYAATKRANDVELERPVLGRPRRNKGGPKRLPVAAMPVEDEEVDLPEIPADADEGVLG